MRFGNTIERLRKSHGLTLTNLSAKSGVPLATLSRIKNNKRTGSLQNHVGLAWALGMKLSKLFAEYEKDGLRFS